MSEHVCKKLPVRMFINDVNNIQRKITEKRRLKYRQKIDNNVYDYKPQSDIPHFVTERCSYFRRKTHKFL